MYSESLKDNNLKKKKIDEHPIQANGGIFFDVRW